VPKTLFSSLIEALTTRVSKVRFNFESFGFGALCLVWVTVVWFSKLVNTQSYNMNQVRPRMSNIFENEALFLELYSRNYCLIFQGFLIQ